MLDEALSKSRLKPLLNLWSLSRGRASSVDTVMLDIEVELDVLDINETTPLMSSLTLYQYKYHVLLSERSWLFVLHGVAGGTAYQMSHVAALLETIHESRQLLSSWCLMMAAQSKSPRCAQQESPNSEDVC